MALARPGARRRGWRRRSLSSVSGSMRPVATPSPACDSCRRAPPPLRARGPRSCRSRRSAAARDSRFAIAAAVDRRDAIGLVEGQPRVERRVAGRGDSGGVGEGGEADAARAPGGERAPVEREAGGRRLEGDRAAGDRASRRPRAPAARGRGRTGSAGRDARDRPRTRPRCRGTTARSGADGRAARSTIAISGPSASRSPGASGGGGGRSSVRVRWSPAPKTTAMNRVGSPGAIQPARRTSIGAPVGRAFLEAGGQRRRVVGDDEVARLEQRRRVGARRWRISPSAATTKSLAVSVARMIGGDHPKAPTSGFTRFGSSATDGVDRAPRRQSSGRFSVDGSASGTASACSGVSMSPGIEREEAARRRPPSPRPRSPSCVSAPPCSRRRRPRSDRG